MFLQTHCNTLPHTWNHLISHFLTNPHRGTYSIDPFEGCLGNCGVRLCNECPEASALHRTATHCNTLHTTQCNTRNNPHHTVYIQRAATQSSHGMQHTMSRLLWCILFVHRHCRIDPPHHQMYANLNRAGSMKTNNTLSLSPFLSFSLSHTHTLSLSLSLTHTHTHTCVESRVRCAAGVWTKTSTSTFSLCREHGCRSTRGFQMEHVCFGSGSRNAKRASS